MDRFSIPVSSEVIFFGVQFSIRWVCLSTRSVNHDYSLDITVMHRPISLRKLDIGCTQSLGKRPSGCLCYPGYKNDDVVSLRMDTNWITLSKNDSPKQCLKR